MYSKIDCIFTFFKKLYVSTADNPSTTAEKSDTR